jgi:hypothetical protein
MLYAASRETDLPHKAAFQQPVSGGQQLARAVPKSSRIESGLRKTFSGELHFYNCHSGESGSGKVSTGKVSFGRMLADLLFTRGYRSCKYFGYLGALDSYQKDGSKGTDIYTRGNLDASGDTALYGADHASSGGELGTMAQARVGIKPTINMVTTGQRLKAFFKRS